MSSRMSCATTNVTCGRTFKMPPIVGLAEDERTRKDPPREVLTGVNKAIDRLPLAERGRGQVLTCSPLH